MVASVRYCVVCGGRFIGRKQSNQIICSKECRKARVHKRSIGRFSIFQRDEFRCIYCGASSIEDGVQLHADHVLPRSQGGKNSADNLATSCDACNLQKHDTLLDSEVLGRILKLVASRNAKFGIDDAQEFKL